MKIIAIAAVSDNGIIGVNGGLPWAPIPEDMKRFRKLTTGHAVIMGRRTWESLPVKPLYGRKNIVVSANPDYISSQIIEESWDAFSLEEAIEYASKKHDLAFIIGGERLYREAFPICDEVYLTRVHQVIKTTEDDVVARFPDGELFDWKFDFEGMTNDRRASFYRYYR